MRISLKTGDACFVKSNESKYDFPKYRSFDFSIMLTDFVKRCWTATVTDGRNVCSIHVT